MAFPQKQQFVFKHFTTVFNYGAANAFYAQIIHMITCSEVFAKSPAFLDSILVYSGQICWREMYSYIFTTAAEKTYLVIQTWRIVK